MILIASAVAAAASLMPALQASMPVDIPITAMGAMRRSSAPPPRPRSRAALVRRVASITPSTTAMAAATSRPSRPQRSPMLMTSGAASMVASPIHTQRPATANTTAEVCLGSERTLSRSRFWSAAPDMAHHPLRPVVNSGGREFLLQRQRPPARDWSCQQRRRLSEPAGQRPQKWGQNKRADDVAVHDFPGDLLGPAGVGTRRPGPE